MQLGPYNIAIASFIALYVIVLHKCGVFLQIEQKTLYQQKKLQLALL